MTLIDNGVEKSVSKVSGFKMDSNIVENNINAPLFKELLKKALDYEKVEIPVNQLRHTPRESLLDVKRKKIIQMNLRNNLSKKRIIRDLSLPTLPYGFSRDMMS